MGLVARVIEAAGVPTVCLANMKGAMLRVKPPRAVITRFPRGQTVGPAGDRETQRRTVAAALELLATTREPGTVVEFSTSP